MRVDLEEYADYWDSGRGYFDAIQMITIVDPAARTNAIITGEAHAIDRVDLKTAHLLKRRPGLNVHSIAGTQHYTFPMRTNVAPFDEPHGRRPARAGAVARGVRSVAYTLVISVEDERGRPVVQEMLAAAERGGDFVDYRWDGADRAAYAVQYTSGLSGKRLVLIGGFSQSLSSVPVEITPLPRPEVTAAEVTDRETLATFVNAAAEAYRDALLTPSYSGLANTKNAFREEGGDWKSGSVYVFVISTEGYTLFHGAQPGRFEGRGFEDMDRQDVNGVRYLRELLAAGEAGGGYVEYMFDNPAVEGDEETGSPKIAYATGFHLPDRDEVFVVGSGIYPPIGIYPDK